MKNTSNKKFQQLIAFIISIFLFQMLFAQEVIRNLPAILQEHCKYLASDELEGRYPGQAGNEKAAEYIKEHFIKYGLLPINNSYYQKFQIQTGIELGKDNSLDLDVIVEKPGVPREALKPIKRFWKINEEWIPLGLSANGKISAELAFVGFGISATDLNYDDYEGIDVKGRAVIIITESPTSGSKTNDFAPYEDLRYKITNARQKGAVAVIFIKIQGDSANVFYPLKHDRMYTNKDILVIQANRTSLAKLFPKHLPLLPTEHEIKKNRKPKSFYIPDATLNLSVELNPVYSEISNVYGIVKGTDNSLSNEYIVVGAHFDHLGWGQENSLYTGKKLQIHNGADDNASGVSAMLELAYYISQNPLKRSVIFIAFNAEEMGLLGSSYYVKNPPFPISNHVFMLNLDMVGRMEKDKKINVFGLGSSPQFNSIIDSLALLDTIQVIKAKESFAPSDQASFYQKDIPVLFLFTGVHSDYHKPTDDWEKLNYQGIAHTVKFTEKILHTIGNAPKKPEFIKEKNDTNESQANLRGGSGAWFGIIPNFEENSDGMLISGTTDGSPAQKAGLQNGDIITKFGDKSIKNLYDLTYALKEYKPGDIVKVIFIRNGKEMSVEVKLGKRNN